MIRRNNQGATPREPSCEKAVPAEEKTFPTESQETEEPSDIRISEGCYKQIRVESLVLLSQGIEHRLERSPDGPFQIFVDPEIQKKAQYQIRLFHRENPPRDQNAPLPLKASFQPVWVLLAPTVVTLAQFSGFIPELEREGISNADKVLNGEWWRCITALTLHGDSRHLGGNLVTGYFVLSLLSYRISIAKLVPFITIASVVANFAVAATIQHNFRSLGFSTFVFAVIGSLSVIEFRLMPRESHGLLRRFAPLFGAASLAVFLGLGENADILAHVYGFFAGILCGFIPKKKSLRWGAPAAPTDIFWIIGYYAIFAIGWYLAHFNA